MQVRFAPLFRLLALVAAAAPMTVLGCGGGEEWDIDSEKAMIRVETEGEVAACSELGAETWASATATARVRQNSERTIVEVELFNGRPDTVYTFWLRLLGTDPETGEPFGSNPITGGGATPLAPTTELDQLIADSAEGAGTRESVSGFVSDAGGNGSFSVELDFPMVGGVYPFDRYDPALPAADILGPPVAPYMFRMISHCVDDLSHGIAADVSENWFDWSP